jgi:hypothetical protein
VTPDDDSSKPLSFRETLATAKQARDSANSDVNAARGQLLAAAIELEGAIDETILNYFQPVEPDQFLDWLLANLNFDGKLQLLRRMIKEHGLWPLFGDFWKCLEEVRLQRNAVAHATLRLLERPSNAVDGNHLLSRRTPKKGEDVTDLEELRAQARSAERLTKEYDRFDWLLQGVAQRARSHKPESADSEEDRKT